MNEVFGKIRNLLAGKRTAANAKKIIKLYEKFTKKKGVAKEEKAILKNYILDHTENWSAHYFRGTFRVWHKRPGYCLIRWLKIEAPCYESLAAAFLDNARFSKDILPERIKDLEIKNIVLDEIGSFPESLDSLRIERAYFRDPYSPGSRPKGVKRCVIISSNLCKEVQEETGIKSILIDPEW